MPAAPFLALINLLTIRPHAFRQDRLWQFAGTAKQERAEIFVPVAFRSLRISGFPSLQRAKLRKQNTRIGRSRLQMIQNGCG